MRKIELAQLQETQYETVLPNGLTVIVHPKAGYHSNYALFATHYGSNDNDFIDLDGKRQTVPAGIAHFLEHKMFDEPQGNVFADFAEMGVSVNAYTSNDITAYMAYGTANFEKALIRLIDFVQNPYFTPESVDKEQGIIAQEIKMYDDHPGWRLQRSLLESLFSQHPVRIDIAGTVESIGRITADLLHTCYRTFYHPSNMILYIVGDMDPEGIMKLVADNQEAKDYQPAAPIKRFFPEEPAAVNRRIFSEKMSVSLPLLALGFKDSVQGLSGKALLKHEVLNLIVTTALLGESSELYNNLYEAGLITEDFSINYEGAEHYAYTFMGGPAPDPEALKSELLKGIADYCRKGISDQELLRIRRKFEGLYTLSFDSQAMIANRYVTFRLKGIDFNDYSGVLESITLEEVNDCLCATFNAEHAVSVVIEPVG